MNKRNYKGNNKRGLQRLAGALQTICWFLAFVCVVGIVGTVGAIEIGDIGFVRGMIQGLGFVGAIVGLVFAGRCF